MSGRLGMGDRGAGIDRPTCADPSPQPAAGILAGRARRFAGERGGAGALEFAVLAPAFLFIVTGIFEVSTMFVADSLLSSAVSDAARSGVTGTSPAGLSREEYIRQAVERFTGGMLDPAKIELETFVYPSFDEVGAPEPFTDDNGNGEWDAGEPYDDVNGNGGWDEDMGSAGLGGPGDIVLYRAGYDWHLLVPTFRAFFPPDGTMRLEATLAIRNEPFPEP